MSVQLKQCTLDGNSLTYQQLVEFIEDPYVQVLLSDQAREQVDFYRAEVDKWLVTEKKVIYGVTTGLGKLKDFVVDEQDQSLFQRKILLSHAAGVGELFPEVVVRLSMLLRANVLSRGHSGVRSEFIDRILELLNRGVCPLVPQIGSLGVGDLQPMAHVGLCLIGAPEGRASFNGEIGSAPDILTKAGLKADFQLSAKEALALIDGSTMVLAASTYVFYESQKLCKLADITAALNMEASRSEIASLDPRIHEANNLETEIETAARIRQMLSGSEWTTDEGRRRLGELKPRVQDAVSLRSTAQVHGAVKDVHQYIRTVLQREWNASKDNPLIFYDGQHFQSMSGGNYHGAHLSYAMDFLGIVMADLAVLSERRSARLLDPMMSYGLPANLTANSTGLNTGFALIDASATAIIGELRLLAAPAGVGSIPAKGNQEDHNSMAMGAVRKAMKIIEYARTVLAIELLCAAQAIDLIRDRMSGLRLGRGTGIIHQLIRSRIEPVWEDRYLLQDLDQMLDLIRSDQLLAVCEERNID